MSIVTVDGVSLLNTNTVSFPISVNYTGILSSSGSVTFTYTVMTDAVTDTNPETGETFTTEGTEHRENGDQGTAVYTGSIRKGFFRRKVKHGFVNKMIGEAGMTRIK